LILIETVSQVFLELVEEALAEAEGIILEVEQAVMLVVSADVVLNILNINNYIKGILKNVFFY
jgi:hypothetical protein